MQIKVLENNEYYNLQLIFRYDAELVARCNKVMKALTWQKFKYDGNLRAWIFNLEDLGNVLREFPGTDVPEDVYSRFIGLQEDIQREVERIEEVRTTPIEVGIPLYEYQKIGVNFLVNNPKCALFDEVRLGKLYQTAGAIHYLKPERVLVICPNTTKINWQRKLKELIDKDSYIVQDEFVEGINIINYEGLQKFANKVKVSKKGKMVTDWEWIDDTQWDMVVVDESHKIKAGKGSIRGKLTESVCKLSVRVILLTATPMPTRTKDLVAQLKIIDKLDEFGGEWSFLMKHCDAKKNRFGWNFSGSSNMAELNTKMKKFSMRRLFAEVWKDIPLMREDVTYLELPEPKAYLDLLNRINVELMEASHYYKETYKRLAGKNKIERAEVLIALQDDKHYKSLTSLAIVKIERLKQEVVRQKLLVLSDILLEYLENKTKVVVFGIHKKTVRELYDQHEENSILITGEVEVKDRTKELDKFMNDPEIYFAFVTMAVGSEGLDFSIANNVIHTELDWTPDNHVQASGRIINTEKKTPTNSNYIVMNNTIEEDIVKTLLDKSSNIDKVIGGTTLSKVLSRIVETSETAF